ncbi:MAG: LTA synthase family protein, partial [Prevotella sp.]|nr:LTA synthase family protein [Prevotella sp.]
NVPPSAAERRRALAGRCAETVAALACVPLMVVGLRGGLSESTTNIGQVYFSARQFLNHAAVNPVFSFAASLEQTVSDMPHYEFMADAEARHSLEPYFPLMAGHTADASGHDTLLTTRRPDILVVLIESCGGMFTALEGDSVTMPRLNALMGQGVNFTRCYANTWRTDRGTLSTWSGYPAFPTYSVMKNPARSRHLPSIASVLRAKGYATHYVYGGDINFTNMRSYLLGTGFERLTWKADYSPDEQRTAEWGVRDDITCRSVVQLLTTGRHDDRPLLVGYSTLSSHQPWDVPISELPGDERNAFRYVDRCLGQLTDSLRQSAAWRNLLVVLLPDHSITVGPYEETHPQRNHIPMLWVGGAVRRPVTVDAVCNQSDLAATLLAQMGLAATDFPFSRDVLSPLYRPMSFHTFNNGFSLTDAQGRFLCHDLNAGRSIVTPADGRAAAHMERLGKAYLQAASRDLQQR